MHVVLPVFPTHAERRRRIIRLRNSMTAGAIVGGVLGVVIGLALILGLGLYTVIGPVAP